MSESPQEQFDLYNDPDAVFKRFSEKCQGKGFSEFVFYCNSLSFSYDWSKHQELSIFELTAHFLEILKNLSTQESVIVVAEDATKSNLQKFINSKMPGLENSFQIDSRLDLINELEKASEEEQEKIMHDLLESYKKKGVKEIVLGCTHFDDPNLESAPGLKVHQPGLALINEVKEQFGARHE
ncbi:hypothetical protein [Halocola ammonii]